MLSRTTGQNIGNRVNDVFSAIRSASDPQSFLTSMISKNPRYAEAMDMAKRYGSDPKEAFYNIAREKGVDPEAYLQGIRSRLKL